MNESGNLLRLTYRRVPGKDTFDGTVEAPGLNETSFTNCKFETIMQMVAGYLEQLPSHRLLIKRQEAPYPMALPQGIEGLLRTNFPKAMEALTVPPQRVHVTPERAVLTTVLKYGTATMAEALGDNVYVKMRNRNPLEPQVESPLTGRWQAVDQFQLTLSSTSISRAGLWGTVRTAELLETNATRFYLPRGWNPSAGWIDSSSLKDMYENYLREKQECIQAIVG